MMLEIWSNFWTLIGGALTLNGQVLLLARDAPRAYWAAMIIAVVAGISMMLGQSVVLFANRVPPGRFLATLFAGSVAFVSRLALWSFSIWVVGVISPRYALPIGIIFLAVCFGQAPQLFSFFEMLPYLGSSLRRVLDAYSLIVVVAGLRWMLDLPVLVGLPGRRPGLAAAVLPGRPAGEAPVRGAHLDVAHRLRGGALRHLAGCGGEPPGRPGAGRGGGGAHAAPPGGAAPVGGWAMIGQLLSDLLVLVGIGLLAVLFIALLAPLEVAGLVRRLAPAPDLHPPGGRRGPAPAAGAETAPAIPEASDYIVFLSGIGDPSAQWHYPEETEFLRRLREALPQAAVISDLFAYSVTSADITATAGRPRTGKMWESIERTVRKNQYAPVGALINLRNLFQVTVSVDHRYGPFFNLGQAENVRDALLAYGYRPGSGKGVFLIGYSGGGQVSLGLAAFLNRMLGSPVTVISVGGVMSSEPSCLQVEHLYHLWGTKDPIQSMGDLAFVGRWPISKKSAWNQALRQGKITRLAMGPVAHNGSGGYFGPQPLPDGRPAIDQTLEVILSIVTTGAPPPDAPPAARPRPGPRRGRGRRGTPGPAPAPAPAETVPDARPEARRAP